MSQAPCRASSSRLTAGRHHGRQRVAHQREHRLREQDLSTVACRADSRGAVDTEPDVPLPSHSRLARMDAHADAELCAVGPSVLGERTLASDRGRDSILGSAEGDEEGVPLRVDLPPTV